MRKFAVLGTLLLGSLLFLAPAQSKATDREYQCSAPCYLLDIYTNEQGQTCIVSYCVCTQETTTDCRDPE